MSYLHFFISSKFCKTPNHDGIPKMILLFNTQHSAMSYYTNIQNMKALCLNTKKFCFELCAFYRNCQYCITLYPVLTWVTLFSLHFIPRYSSGIIFFTKTMLPRLKLDTNSGFYGLFLKYTDGQICEIL
jgi:hypothetical protein